MRCDTLTGLMNRRAFIDCFRREIARATEEESSVTCLMIDIDFFKRVNDLHGHAIGDRALQGIADLLATLGRSGDKVCRYGGEEFCVILRGADEVAAAEWAELVRAQLVKTPIRNGGNKLTVTASFGVASMTEANTTPEQLIEQADSALRSAKQQGRDRVCRFSTLAREHETQKRGCLKRPFHSIDTAQLMSPAMVVKQNATLRDAAEILLKHELAAAPVVDHEGRMVGVLSESDLLRVFSDDSQQSMRVQHAMRASVVGFSEDTSLQEIFDFVVRVSIPQVVIVRDGKPCGVVGRQALLSLLFSQGFGDDQLTQPQATASSLPATIPLTPPPAPGATVPGPASTV